MVDIDMITCIGWLTISTHSTPVSVPNQEQRYKQYPPSLLVSYIDYNMNTFVTFVSSDYNPAERSGLVVFCPVLKKNLGSISDTIN